jgi:lysozyme family protein
MQLEELSNISDNLAMMPDPALQQFAQMHKTDPYMVSLALSESNRRKKIRTAAQGQAGAAPKPKVVDAAIQGMTPAPAPVVAQTALPENQGIAQIPAPNMQRLADGGIAGYGDDEEQGMATGGMGGMFNFAQQSEPVIRMSGGGMAGYMPGFKNTGSVNAAFEAALQKTLGYEGGYVADDAGKGPSNFGINASANPDVDVKNLTKEKARELYKKRYWDAIGGDALAAKNPALATVAFDTAVNMGVSKANQLVAKAKDDPSALLGLRQQHYDNLVKKDPEKFAPYEKGWKARVADLATSVIPSAQAGELPKPGAAAPEYQGEKAKQDPRNLNANASAVGGTSLLSGLSALAPRFLDKFAPSLVNDPKALAQTLRASGVAGGTLAAVPAIGGMFTVGATNALSNATPEQLAQMEGFGADPSGTSFGAAILNPENRKPENAPKMSYADQMTNVAKTIVQHPDIDRMREANKAKTEKAKVASYDPNNMVPISPDEFGSAVGIPEPALPKPEEKAVVEAAKEATPAKERKGFNNDDLLTLGLSLLANKSPNFMTALGEAGLATVAGKKEREKIEREEAKLKGSEELQKAQAKYYGSYADAIERGAKEKNEQLQAEQLVQKHMESWEKNNKIASIQDPMARLQEENRARQQIYANLGLKPIMAGQASPAGAGDFKIVGVR